MPDRHIVTRFAREIGVGDVIVWRGLYLPVTRVEIYDGFLFGPDDPSICLYLGNSVRGGIAMHPANLALAPNDLVTRWEKKWPPNS